MFDRSRQSAGSHSFSPQSSCESDEPCLCCAAIQRARAFSVFDSMPEWGSPLTPGVQLVNLSHNADGSLLRVDLSRDWPRMFEQLPLVGPGLVMTRNEAAILGQRMHYPCLDPNGYGVLQIDHSLLGAARAVHLRRETGHIFGIEFYDPAGHTIHRFTTTPRSDLDAFFDWVRLHQNCGETFTRPTGEALGSTAPEPVSIVRTTDSGALVSVFTACGERNLPIRATVHAGAIVQRTHFVPVSLQSIDGWWFASDDIAGLHFHTDQFTGIDLAVSTDPARPHLQLRAHTETCEPALVLEPGTDASGEVTAAWHDLLHAFA